MLFVRLGQCVILCAYLAAASLRDEYNKVSQIVFMDPIAVKKLPESDPVFASYLYPIPSAERHGPYIVPARHIDTISAQLAEEFVSDSPECRLWLKLVLHHPEWFALTRRDIAHLRSCLGAISESSDPRTSSGPLSKFLLKTINLVYSREIEMFTRRVDKEEETLMLIDAVNRPLYPAIQSKIADMIPHRFKDSSSSIDFASLFDNHFIMRAFMDPIDDAFLDTVSSSPTRGGTTDIPLTQLPNFAHTMVLRMMSGGHPWGVLKLEILLLEKLGDDTGHVELEHFIEKSYFGPVPNAHWLRTHNLSTADTPNVTWINSVLDYGRSISDSNPIPKEKKRVQKCLSAIPSTLDEKIFAKFVQSHPARLVYVFECLTSLLLDPSVSLPLVSPQRTLEHTVGTWFAIARFAFSPISTIISFKNSPLRIRANKYAIDYFVGIEPGQLGEWPVGLSNENLVYEVDVYTFKLLAKIFHESNSCLYWFVFETYPHWSADLQKTCLDIILPELLAASNAATIVGIAKLDAYIERLLRDSVSWTDPVQDPIPPEKSLSEYPLTREMLTNALSHSVAVAAAPMVGKALWEVQRQLDWRKLLPAVAHVAGANDRNISPAPRVVKLIQSTLDSIDIYSYLAEIESKISLDPITAAFLRGLHPQHIFSTPETVRFSLPIFVEIFDHVLEEIFTKLEKSDWHLSLVMFKLMLDSYLEFDKLDLVLARVPMEDKSFAAWSGSLQEPNKYLAVLDLFMSTWAWGDERNAISGSTSEFDPVRLCKCFPNWLFRPDVRPHADPRFSSDMHVTIITMWKERTTPAQYISHHYRFIKALLEEEFWLPGCHRDGTVHGKETEATTAVAQLLYVLRMVSGAPAFLRL